MLKYCFLSIYFDDHIKYTQTRFYHFVSTIIYFYTEILNLFLELSMFPMFLVNVMLSNQFYIQCSSICYQMIHILFKAVLISSCLKKKKRAKNKEISGKEREKNEAKIKSFVLKAKEENEHEGYERKQRKMTYKTLHRKMTSQYFYTGQPLQWKSVLGKSPISSVATCQSASEDDCFDAFNTYARGGWNYLLYIERHLLQLVAIANAWRGFCTISLYNENMFFVCI